jgi:hypothetical protein
VQLRPQGSVPHINSFNNYATVTKSAQQRYRNARGL